MRSGYEFKVFTITSLGMMEDELNKLGRDGWKVVAFLPSRTEYYTFVMERYLEVVL